MKRRTYWHRTQTVVALLALGVVINVLIVAEGQAAGFGPRSLAIVTPAAIVGLPVGAELVASLGQRTLQAALGCSILVLAALQARQATTRPKRAGGSGDVRLGIAAGGLSGVLTTATAIGAAPVVLWLERQAAGGAQVRYGIALYSLILCGVGGALVAGRRRARPARADSRDGARAGRAARVLDRATVLRGAQ
jgi:uncharacterized membrane protein YfcA